MQDNTQASIYDILYSITQVKDKDLANNLIDKLNNCGVLDTDEKETLNIFNGLVNELNTIPEPGTLVSRNIAFQTANTIIENSLEDLTKIFIVNKKKMNIASTWTNASMEIMKPGANIDAILDRVTNAEIKYNPKEINEEKYSTADNTEEFLAKLHEVKEEIKGIPFGIDFVDSLYPGILPGSYNIIAGYAGSMKTTITLNMCYIGMRMGYNTLYISLEVNKEDIIMNLMTLHSLSMNEPVKRSDMPKLRYKDPDKFDRIYRSLMSLDGKIEIYDETDIERYSKNVFTEIIRKTAEMFKKKETKLDHIVLDHAQLLKYDETNTQDPYKVLNNYIDFFRRFAARDLYAVTIVSQTSRTGYEYACKHGGVYLLTGLAEGNELERGSTFAMTVFSSDNLKSSGQLQVQILKNRYGETMPEPQLANIRPEYYMIGDGYGSTPQQVGSVFEDNGEFINPFTQNNEETNLDDILGGM